MNKKKKLVIVLLLLVALVGTIVYITRLKNHETVEQPKVAETAKENKTDKKTDTKTDNKSDKKNETKTSDKKEDVKADDKKEDVKSETNTSTTTSTENTTSTTPGAPKNTETATSNKTDTVPAPCVPTYTTVNHPEQGHYETRVVKEAEYVPVYDRRAVGGQTGRIYNDLSEFDNQDEDYSYSVKTVQVGTEYHEAVTEQVWVVDQPAYTTTETSGC
jgi:hypothetical protein